MSINLKWLNRLHHQEYLLPVSHGNTLSLSKQVSSDDKGII